MTATYIPRIIDTELDEHLATFPAVCIEGPKWCGKTTTATMHAASSISLADPEGNFRNRTMAQLEPSLAMQGSEPRLIDEWQEVPAIWDTVRFICDANPTHGRFLLTGSATPRQSQQPMHSGAGRIARLHMSSMTLAEQGKSSSEVSLRGLFDGQAYTAQSHLTLEQISQCIVRGGWPAALELDDKQASLTAEGYLDAIAHEDISEVDDINRDPVRVQRLLASLGRNEATLASKTTLLKDTTGQARHQRNARTTQASQLAETTLNEYMGALERMHVVEDVPAWAPALRSPVRIRSTRKHHLADPSLAAAAIGATTDTLRTDPKTLGFLFESLATHDLMVYARAIDAHVMHYRDDSHLEVDLIVEMRDGRWGAFEVKLGSAQIEDGAANVNALDRKMRERGQRAASVKAVIVGTGAIAHRRDDGVQVIPLDTLGV
ncbi:ATP-binding protein [Bifidobacterium panos]|uniref:AAA domain-containing protein n=1 Tax=Bifidobacterium panos TaxID=2675321 RepID=A0ABX1SX56_9BIFI|nr:DUF4143 domain-containing protein [Bifidobacterium sp. DSM 109963]NMN02433.1 AAA domain-containing protein [Bifidobacterium sp. DSM 109963]